MPDRRPPVDWWGYNTNKSPYQPARTPAAARTPAQSGGIDWRDLYGSPDLGMPPLMFNPETGMWFDPSNPLAPVYADRVSGIPLSWLDYVNRPAAAPPARTPVAQPNTPQLPPSAPPATGITYNPVYTMNAVYQARSKSPAGQWPSSGLIDQSAPPAATSPNVGSLDRQTQLRNWFDWAQSEGKRPGWYGGAPGSGAYQTNLGEILNGEQNWYYDPFYGNFTANVYGSGAFPGKGTVKDNQYGADWQRRINESKGKIGPEYEKLRRKRRNLGNLPRKKPQPEQKSGGVGSGGQFGMGSFDY